MAVGIGDVDIYEVNTNALLVENLAFGASGVLDVPAGPYTLGIDATNDGVAEFIFAVPDLGSDILVDVFAVTEANGTPFLHAQFPDGNEARVDVAAPANVRVLHLSPDAPNVDIWVNDALSGITDLPYEISTTYVELPPGLHNFKVTATGAALGTEVLDFDLVLQPGEFYTAVAYGSLASILPMPLVDNYASIAMGDVRLQIAHAAEGVGNVDVTDESAGATLIIDLPYGGSETLDAPDMARTVGLDVDLDGTADFTFDVPMLGGSLVNVFAVLPPGSGPVLVAQFDDGATVTIPANP